MFLRNQKDTCQSELFMFNGAEYETRSSNDGVKVSAQVFKDKVAVGDCLTVYLNETEKTYESNMQADIAQEVAAVVKSRFKYDTVHSIERSRFQLEDFD
jgi:hypothetical protein